ncbi:hypothetical protein E2C01_019857 [Portunus trituberculatus]|uniref:Uncharacterized protein n=1 Tax=Portunus trituberculatus TaxID=210409 RepID=A0A5B7DYK6_PORTR|nr:hypothetical protein [Portunus trituberculatus]
MVCQVIVQQHQIRPSLSDTAATSMGKNLLDFNHIEELLESHRVTLLSATCPPLSTSPVA